MKEVIGAGRCFENLPQLYLAYPPGAHGVLRAADL